MNLTEREICDLTAKERHSAQARALRHIGIDFKTRADGSLVVSRIHAEKMLGGTTGNPVRVKSEPNWQSI